MPRYEAEVIEVQHVRYLDRIEAGNTTKAETKAMDGDTISSVKLADEGVYHRELLHTPKLVGAAGTADKSTRTVEYYRLWEDHTWDTEFIDILASTPDAQIEEAIREAAYKIGWRDEVPVAVGLYCLNGQVECFDDETEDDEVPDSGE